MLKNRLPIFLSFLMAITGCSKKVATPQDALDRSFEEMMKGVSLVGRSTRLSADKVATGEKLERQEGRGQLFGQIVRDQGSR